MKYFAIENVPYGRAIERGRRIGRIFAFASRASREAWLAEGNPYPGQPGGREALLASHPAVRAAVRMEAEHAGYGYCRGAAE